MNKTYFQLACVALLVPCFTLCGHVAHAQGQSDGRSLVIEEILVTANRRVQSIQDVSASITAIDESQLKLGGIQDVTRLEHLVPGMKFGRSGNEVRLAIRGSRTNNVGTEAEQVIGIFEDGVYVPTTTQALGAYVDVNRIEVLRGPQGTLYGRNTFGGTVNVITNEPEFDRTYGNVSALYGDYDRVRLEGVANLPLGDQFAVRIAAMSDVHDGYVKNTNDPGTGDDLLDQDLQFFRVTGKWVPNDEFDVSLRLTHSEQDTNGSGIWGYQEIAGFVDGVFMPGHSYAPADASANFDQGPYVISRNQRSAADTESFSATLTANWDVGFGLVKLIANATDFEGLQIYDPDYSDGGDPTNSGFVGWANDQDTKSYEVHLLSNEDAPFEWMLGYYYYEQVADWNWQMLVDDVNVTPSWDTEGNYTSDSTGIFANATFDLSETTRLLAGLRYAEDSKDRKDRLDLSTSPPTVVEEGLAGSWDQTLWKVGLEHDVNDAMMVYGTASTGYRAGGINFVAPNVPLRYEPEDVTAYEIGLKSTLADGTAVLNVAAFLNDYENLQAGSVTSVAGSNATTVFEYTENAGEIESKGLEVELRWYPTEQLDIGLTAAYLDAEFGDYTVTEIEGLGNLGGRQNLDDTELGVLQLRGWTPAMSPDFTMGLQIGYDINLQNGSKLTPFLQSTYTSEHATQDVNVRGVFQSAYTKSDIRLIWTSPSEKLTFEGFVLNVEDEAVLTRTVVYAPGGTTNTTAVRAFWNAPRTWGVRALLNFE